MINGLIFAANRFQSTLPCGSDDGIYINDKRSSEFQSTLPCGSDHISEFFTPTGFCISIHAPLRERPAAVACRVSKYKFQSTLPCGSDQKSIAEQKASSRHFNPRSLAGATRLRATVHTTGAGFQSTLPCGSDYVYFCVVTPKAISIHAPLRERHAYALQYIRLALDFNPRSLAGATMFTFALSPLKLFQSTLPCGSDI